MTPLEQKLAIQLVAAVESIAIALQNIAQQLQAANLMNPARPVNEAPATIYPGNTQR